MTVKTHKTAVVLIPPEDIWGPIQALRRRHDRKLRRWMPHITLLYPFRPCADLPGLCPALEKACAALRPFEVRLAELRYFHHEHERYTLWLAPEPEDTLVQLQESLWQLVPECDDTRRFGRGFTPHLSLGQVRGHLELMQLLEHLQDDWEPLTFTADAVNVIRRGDPPDDVFQVERALPLGG
jgi:2'-5' RNA ligase